MTQQTIETTGGATGFGDSAVTGTGKINANFTELYAVASTTAQKAAIAGQPALASNNGYDAYIYCPPNGATIYYRLDNLNTGATIIDSSTTTTLPVNTTLLSANALASNAALTPVTSIQLGVNHIYVETDK